MASKSARVLWARHLERGPARRIREDPPVALGERFSGCVLGVDPSLRGSGFALVEYPAGANGRVLASRTLKLKPGLPMAHCLGEIGRTVEALLSGHRVRHVAVEQTIFVQNNQTAQVLGAARGAVIAVAVMRGAEVFEYAPLRVKQAVVGLGRASKEQVARTVCHLTGTDFGGRLDESDAAAVALCHAFSWRGAAGGR